MRPLCPFDGATWAQHLDKKGYTMLVCPTCDARFRADAFVDKPHPTPQIVPMPYPVYPYIGPYHWRPLPYYGVTWTASDVVTSGYSNSATMEVTHT